MQPRQFACMRIGGVETRIWQNYLIQMKGFVGVVKVYFLQTPSGWNIYLCICLFIEVDINSFARVFSHYFPPNQWSKTEPNSPCNYVPLSFSAMMRESLLRTFGRDKREIKISSHERAMKFLN